jgi:ABC-type transport system substrate-binding protein
MPGDAARLDPVRHDPKRARELLQASGFARGFYLEIWFEESREARRLLDALRIGLREIGVELKAVGCSPEELRAVIEKGTADAVLIDVRPECLGSYAVLHHRFHSGSFGPDANLSGYESNNMDRLLGRIDRARARSERLKLSAQAEKHLQEASPWIPLWHPVRLVAVAPDIEGYQPAPDHRLERFLSIRRRAAEARPPEAPSPESRSPADGDPAEGAEE